MELAQYQNGFNSDLERETPRLDFAKEGDDEKVLAAIDIAIKYGFCLNRIWAVARTLTNQI